MNRILQSFILKCFKHIYLITCMSIFLWGNVHENLIQLKPNVIRLIVLLQLQKENSYCG